MQRIGPLRRKLAWLALVGWMLTLVPARELLADETSPPAPPASATGTVDWQEGRVVSAAQTENVWGTVEPLAEKNAGLVVPRALLFLPRMVLRYGLLLPVEKLAYFIGRLQGNERVQIVLLTLYRTGFRPSLGLRFVRHFSDEKDSTLTATASYGGRNFFVLEGDYRRRFGEVSRLKLGGRFRQQGDKRFYGIGNEVPEENESRYFFEEARALASYRHAWSAALLTEAEAGWYRMRTSDTGDFDEDDFTVSQLFDPAEVPGFGVAQNYVLASAAAALDVRSEPVGRHWGLLLRSHADAYLAVSGQSVSTLVYGGEIAGSAPLFRDRVLAVRFLLEAASDLGDDSIPFYLLPAAGRGGLLRGYSSGRLRDRILAVASAEYRWPVFRFADAVAFVDIGRVAPELGELDFSDWKWGAGVGFRWLSRRGASFSAQFAHSPEKNELIVLTGDDLF